MKLEERFVTIATERNNEELKQKYFEQVINILKKSYEKIGGLKSLDSDDEILRPEYIWKLVKRGETITACILYKGTLQDRKLVLAGCDQTPSGKQDLYKIIQEDIKYPERYSWGEVSDALEHIFLKYGAKTHEFPEIERILSKLGKNIETSDDRLHYKRKIGNTLLKKSLVGNVPNKYLSDEDSIDSEFLKNQLKK